jgi:hypothetical protein
MAWGMGHNGWGMALTGMKHGEDFQLLRDRERASVP